MIELILGALFTLIIGSYGWATMIYRWLSDQINTLKTNHLKHIEERLEALESKNHANQLDNR